MEFERVKSIKKIGIENVYDLETKEHNYICNDIIVHNSSFGLLDTFSEFKEAKDFLKKYPFAADIAIKLEGHLRHLGIHAAAMVVTEKPIYEYVPINKLSGETIIEFEKFQCEELNLIKFDILGLKTLTILKDCCRDLGIKLPIEFNDKEVIDNIFKTGDTLGVFQLNTVGMTKFIKQLQPDSFKEIYDTTTLFRPSALHSGQAQNYINIKHGKTEDILPFESLKKITQDTKGLILYQEQVMQILNQVGDLSWATAEMSRKVMTKSKGKDAMNTIRVDFVKNAQKKHDLSEKDAEKIFDIVSTFGCLTGDTIIYRSSSNQHKNKELTIQEAFDYQSSDNFKYRGLKILSMSSDGFVRPHSIKCIHDTGIQEVFYIRTISNKKIKATKNHRFLINGEWKQVKDIKEGDYIEVSDLKKAQKNYSIGLGTGNHSICPRFRKGEGYSNKLINRRKELIKNIGHCQQCNSRERLEMHHFNHNQKDNSKENTILLCRRCHKRIDKTIDFSRFQKGYYTSRERICEIKKMDKKRRTFDIEMTEEPRNFIANNFVSHNSYGFNKCLSKDTTILIPSGRGMKRITIEQAHKEKPSEIYSYNSDTKKSFKAPIKEIVKTGKKEVFEVLCRTNRYRKIKTTKEHKFLTKQGWKKLKDLKIGDEIMLKAPSTILFGEKNSRFNKIPWEYAPILNIETKGIEETYDVHVDHPEHNYIANMFVVHNSHAVEYSMISYWCGWLKYYYPKNFYKSILKYEEDNKLISATMQEMENKNIHLEFPDINHSDFSFSIFNNKIYCGLNTIKGIGEKTAEKIINNRPYISKKDFLQKTKVSQKIFKGLEVADSFREIEEIKQEHSLQELLKYTKIKPKNKIKDVYDFGSLPFKDICNLTEEDKNKPTVLRGIITEVVNKDKLLRKTLDDFKIKFEKHRIYLNLNDGTDDLALQVDPGHYQFLKDKIERADNQLVIVVGILNNDAKKMYLEELEFLNDPIENRKITKTFEENKKNKPGETFIASAQPKVSKKGKSYYNIILFNGIKGMCFFFDEALKFGDKVKEYRIKDSFINLIIDKNR